MWCVYYFVIVISHLVDQCIIHYILYPSISSAIFTGNKKDVQKNRSDSIRGMELPQLKTGTLFNKCQVLILNVLSGVYLYDLFIQNTINSKTYMHVLFAMYHISLI